jgi:hypothetical protein
MKKLITKKKRGVLKVFKGLLCVVFLVGLFTTKAKAQCTNVPVISCPADITVNSNSHCGTVVSFNASVVSGDLPVSVTYSPQGPGSFFSIGTTQITVTSTNCAGAGNSCTFNVIVTDNEQQLLVVQLHLKRQIRDFVVLL